MPNINSGIILSRDRFTFSAAHFSQLSGGKSEPLHGHNYRVLIEIIGSVDGLGFIADFSYVKQCIMNITSTMNHKILVPLNSPRIVFINRSSELELLVDGKRYVFPIEDVFYLPSSNTTCEELSRYIAKELAAIISNIKLKVTVLESENQGAFAILEPF